MPANDLSPKPKKRRRNPIIAQREARARLAAANAGKPSGQVVPPGPPNPSKPGPPTPPAPAPAVVSKAREALETLPDGELVQKAEILLPDYEEDWDRNKLIDELLKAGVAS